MSGSAGAHDDLVLQLPRSRVARWFASRPRIGDVAVILACAVSAGAVLVLAAPEPTWLGWACVLAVAVTLWWRRRHPLTVLLLIVGIAALNPAYALSVSGPTPEIIFGSFALAAASRLRTAVLGFLAAAAVVLAASALAVTLGIREELPAVLLQPEGIIALAVGMAVRASRARADAIEDAVALREERAAAAERARITAEMHDVVAHSVTVMVALAGGAAAGWEKHPERARAALRQLGEVGGRTLEEMQRILRVLRDHDPVLDQSLESSGHNLPSLEELVEVFRTAGLPVSLAADADLPDDPALRTSVYRIVQESLTNVLRHGRGVTVVEVRITRDDGRLVASVVDNGRGGPGADVGAGVGLRAMRARAEAFHGRLEAGPVQRDPSAPGSGWRTRATIPLETRSA